jgi:hypothetical protein
MYRITIFVMLTVVFSACDKSQNNEDQTPVKIEPIPGGGATCFNGGVKVTTADGDFNICNGTPVVRGRIYCVEAKKSVMTDVEYPPNPAAQLCAECENIDDVPLAGSCTDRFDYVVNTLSMPVQWYAPLPGASPGSVPENYKAKWCCSWKDMQDPFKSTELPNAEAMICCVRNPKPGASR